MSVAGILSNGVIMDSYLPKAVTQVAYIASGPGLVSAINQNITLSKSGFYLLQTYISKDGAGAVDSTTSTVFSCDASEGWGHCCYTPAMLPPFATEPGASTGLTSSFFAEAGATVLRLSPGASLNVGANGNCEAILWYVGPV